MMAYVNYATPNHAMGKALEKYVMKGLVPLSLFIIFGSSLLFDGISLFLLPALLMGVAFLVFYVIFFSIINLIMQ